VRQNGTPILDQRGAPAILNELLSRRPAYTPEWIGREGGPGRALAQVFSRYMQALIVRLNQTPDLNKLAFLDMLGFSLIPPQAARAPIVFQLTQNAVDSRVPAGTRLAAPPGPGRPGMINFETEAAIGLASAKLAEVVTLWPGRDQYANHSYHAVGGRSFRLFQPLQPVPHILYLAHKTLLRFAGKSIIEITFEMLTPSKEQLNILWEFWDGKVWRGFKPFEREIGQGGLDESVDDTQGLTRAGIVRLATDCAGTEKRKVNDIESFWVRGRLADTEQIPPDPAAQLPVLETIRLNTAIERPLSLFTEVSIQYEPLTGRNLRAAPVRVSVLDEAAAPVIILTEWGELEQGTLVTITSPDDPGFKPITDRTNQLGFAEFLGREIQRERDYLFEAKFDGIAASTRARVVEGARLSVGFTLKGLLPDKAFNDTTPLDMAKAFYPFGQSPQPGTAFYFTNEEILSKPGAEVEVLVVRAPTPQDISAITTMTEPTPTPTPPPGGEINLMARIAVNERAPRARVLDHIIAWEYWNGSRWLEIAVKADPVLSYQDQDDTPDLNNTTVVRFTVPVDIARVKVNEQEAPWMRVRLVSGGFGSFQEVTWVDMDGLTNRTVQILPKPPALSTFRMGYVYRSPKVHPEVTLTYNDFRYEDHTGDVLWPGQSFLPYEPVADSTPTLYLGFNQPLPVDQVSLFVNIEEVRGIVKGPPLEWEYWDGTAWRELFVNDETENLRLPGMLSFIGPSLPPRPALTIIAGNQKEIQTTSAEEAARFQRGDLIIVQQANTQELATVERVQGRLILTRVPLSNLYTGGSIRLADLARFGTPRFWVRGRMREDGTPADSPVNGIYLNAAWAAQIQTVSNELLGGSTGQPGQVYSIRQTPVLEDEMIEVRELEGERAEVEFSVLKQELLRQGVSEGDMREIRNSSGRLTEVWIRWHSRPHLFFSGLEDRHYIIDRTRGLLIFGNGVNGKIPPIGANNLLARRYRFGGGQAGNVPSGSITQLLGGVPAVQAITNPRRAEGGADGEPVEAVKSRATRNLRHRWRALSTKDYEDLAMEASPAISAVQVLPTTGPDGHHSPGWVTLMILPQSPDRHPQPSFELRRQVVGYLQERAPAQVGGMGKVYVTGPDYLPIGVSVVVIPLDPAEAGPVEQRVRQALERFLHPAIGGPEGRGWSFGRDVYLSDVAAVLEVVEGVDHVEELHLVLDGAVQEERVAVPPLKMVAAGELRIRVLGPGL
jgi:hypothetical protein